MTNLGIAAVSGYVDYAPHNYKEYHLVVERVNGENCALYKLAIHNSPGHWGSDCPAWPPWRAR